MRSSNSEISLYVDTLIVQTLLTDAHLRKTANAITDLMARVKDYFGNQIRPDDKAGSLLDLIAPTLISGTFSALGLPWLGVLLGLATRVFHINISGILSSIYNKIRGEVTSNNQMSSSQVDGIVDGAVQTHVTNEDTAEKKESKLLDSKILKLAMIEWENSGFESHGGLLSGRKASTVSLLGTVLKWFFKMALASAGFMVAGDVINKFLNRPNALDGTIQKGRPVGTPSSVPQVISKQTKFKVNPSYHPETKNSEEDNWSENIHNDKGSIANMLLDWAKKVYQGLDGLDSIIENTAGFQATVDAIAWQNSNSPGASIIFIPKMFTSKKMVVDHFIDEVAEKAA